MKKDNYILLIIIAAILISVLGIMYFGKDDSDTNSDNEIQYKLLSDYSKFFTVNSCVYKYISYLSSGDTENILNVLDNDYKLKNNINKNNLFNYVKKLDGSYSFKAKKIYYGEISDDYISYLVYGYLIKDSLGNIISKEDYYITVNMDLNNHLFSVAPYDGKIFKEAK